MTTSIHRPMASKAILLVGILLIAANLRAPFTGLPPLLGFLASDFNLSTTAASALTTLPLLAFAIVSPLSARVARALGIERALFVALVVIAAGIGLRSTGPLWGLYVGTGLIGMGIAVGNVLLPSLIKRDFPYHIAALTGAYALSMGVAAALLSGLAVPMAEQWGWSGSLGAFIVLPLAALAVWVTQLKAPAPQAAEQQAPSSRGISIWRVGLAWQVTLFFGLNSTIYYVGIGWLPAILADAGMSPERAGSVHGVLQFATAVPGLVLGLILRHIHDQRLPAAGSALMSAVALLGLMAAPQQALWWSVLFGLGTGSGIIMGLTFIGLRTGSAQQAASLSGMAQCIGYLLAAAGPPIMGVLHDSLGSWTVPLGICAMLALVIAVMGLLAGRDRHIACSGS
ncbi:MFS transporter [Vreelandella subglaciescola]|uniref:MFS transporter, CP family, cyanate transporter n=1 Tax=Vreelandella subglaciescola TaxID=29571 RepID=A0A1M7EIG5_9GAMM|nr:MFS transporter [Halomonas subglaciescola]SHL91513.1 MFS transporter, CP family, cyanate transporter [Halomonas subglaciescola]